MASDPRVPWLLYLDTELFNYDKHVEEITIIPNVSLGWDKRNNQRVFKLTYEEIVLLFNYRYMIEGNCYRVWRDVRNSSGNHDIPFEVAMKIFFEANQSYLDYAIRIVTPGDYRMCDRNHELIIENAEALGISLNSDVSEFHTCGNCFMESSVFSVESINKKRYVGANEADEHNVLKNFIFFNPELRKNLNEFDRIFKFIFQTPENLVKSIRKSAYTVGEELI